MVKSGSGHVLRCLDCGVMCAKKALPSWVGQCQGAKQAKRPTYANVGPKGPSEAEGLDLTRSSPCPSLASPALTEAIEEELERLFDGEEGGSAERN